jgi:putative transposase
MARIDRDDGRYHVMNRSVNRQVVFFSDAMQLLGAVCTRHANDRIGRDGPLFRGRFHSILIVSDAQLVASVRSVHRNALDLDGVADVLLYRWSSHRSYLGHR